MLLLLNVVGLTPEHIGEHTSCLRELATSSGAQPLNGSFPALTLSAQATMLTATPPRVHGIVGNGWLFRETGEPRLWQQSRALVMGDFFYEQAQREGFTVAKLFWWFNQGGTTDFSLTPKPFYSCDGNKAFAVHGWPESFAPQIEAEIGRFPFPSFWGPNAGLPATQWIARATAWTIKRHRPDLVMAYLPHLDYDLQRFGATGPHLIKNLHEIDACVKIAADAARAAGYEIAVVSEYGISTVRRPININLRLREAGLLAVRPGPFGETLETFQSRAFAVADHQIAHIYIRDPRDLPAVREALAGMPGIGALLDRREQAQYQTDHPRAGDLLALSDPDSWFTWYYSPDSAVAPDFAGTVDIHRKPGYDPAELFYDPRQPFPRLKAAAILLRKLLGFRYRFDVISRDPSLVRGSHGLPAARPSTGPVFLTTAAHAPQNPGLADVGAFVLHTLRQSGPARSASSA